MDTSGVFTHPAKHIWTFAIFYLCTLKRAKEIPSLTTSQMHITSASLGELFHQTILYWSDPCVSSRPLNFLQCFVVLIFTNTFGFTCANLRLYWHWPWPPSQPSARGTTDGSAVRYWTGNVFQILCHCPGFTQWDPFQWR